MPGWFLVQGKENEQTLGEIVAAGAREIALAGADLIFAPGDQLFISEADASETEFLGAATNVTSAEVEFALPLAKSKNTGALLWRSARAFAASAEESLPLREAIHTGAIIERSLGGEIYAVRAREPHTLLQWGLDGLTPAREAEFRAWFAAAGAGLDPFTLVSPARKLTAVRLADENYQRTTHPGGRISLRFSLAIDAENQFA
jgi:hypothetical protein